MNLLLYFVSYFLDSKPHEDRNFKIYKGAQK